MEIDPQLLALLACPVCKTPVEHRARHRALVCVKCRRQYAVKDGIPNMLVEEAKIVEP